MKKRRKPGALYFTDVSRVDLGAVVLTANYYILEESDDQRTALLSFNKGNWGGIDLSGIAHAVRHQRSSGRKKEYLVLERNRGLYRITPPATVKFEKINDERQGFLMDLQKISGKWYAVGGHHQVYREESGSWNPIDSSIYVPGEEGEAKNLLSIDGNSESDIYTVGLNGVIFHYNGNSWRQLDSPTNLGFQKVLCVSSDEVYICGYSNSLYYGNTNGWEPLTEIDNDTIFWDMTYFKGAVYICSKKKIFILKDKQLQEIEIPVKGPLGFYRMDSDEHELWTCGNECLLKFDGNQWEQYVFPDNV